MKILPETTPKKSINNLLTLLSSVDENVGINPTNDVLTCWFSIFQLLKSLANEFMILIKSRDCSDPIADFIFQFYGVAVSWRLLWIYLEMIIDGFIKLESLQNDVYCQKLNKLVKRVMVIFLIGKRLSILRVAFCRLRWKSFIKRFIMKRNGC